MLKQFLIPLILTLLAGPGAFAQKSMIDRLVDRVLAPATYTARHDLDMKIDDSLGQHADYMVHYYYLDTLTKRSHRLGDRHMEGNAYMGIGNFCLNNGNNYGAVEAFNKAIELFEPDKNYRGLCNAYTNLGNTYFYTGNEDKALQYYKKGIGYYKKDNAAGTDDELRLANIYNNLGGVYCTKGDYVYGRTYLNLAMALWTKHHDSLSMGYLYNNFGEIFHEKGQYDSALFYFKKALPLKVKFGDTFEKAGAYNALAACYLRVKQPQEALKNLERSLLYVNPAIPNRQLLECYMGFYEAYHQLNDCGRELNYFKLYKAASDSANWQDQQTKIARRELQFQFSNIHLADSIRSVQEIKLKDVKLTEKKKESYFLIFALLLTVVALSLIYSRFRLTQKQKQIIEAQKLTVDEKNREIIESINYAKRLQEAILPPLTFMKETLPRSFVIYQPKDIVAGDFYWMEAVERPERRVKSVNEISQPSSADSPLILVAAADCTGHGVPGAMVSVVCSNALNRAVKEFGLTDPGRILDKVRELVIETFEKSENDVKDGMDISLLALDRKNRVVKWSGAHNRLLYVRDGQLNEVKADRQPVGKSDHLKGFTSHELPYEPGSLFYLFTDGIVDQFGGENAKKFTISNFKNLLQSISGMDVTAQRNAILERHAAWKGSLEQIDDITVIGIKL